MIQRRETEHLEYINTPLIIIVITISTVTIMPVSRLSPTMYRIQARMKLRIFILSIIITTSPILSIITRMLVVVSLLTSFNFSWLE